MGAVQKKNYRFILVQARCMASSVSSHREKDIGKMEREREKRERSLRHVDV